MIKYRLPIEHSDKFQQINHRLFIKLNLRRFTNSICFQTFILVIFTGNLFCYQHVHFLLAVVFHEDVLDLLSPKLEEKDGVGATVELRRFLRAVELEHSRFVFNVDQKDYHFVFEKT